MASRAASKRTCCKANKTKGRELTNRPARQRKQEKNRARYGQLKLESTPSIEQDGFYHNRKVAHGG